MIRVAVIASSPVVRAGLEALLREEARFAIASSAGPPGSLARGHNADVLLMEIAAADKLGSFRTLGHRDERPTVLLVDRLGRAELRRVLQSGVRAILPRDAGGPEILAAIEGVAAGLTVLSSEEMDALLPARSENIAAEMVIEEALSAREIEVLAMIAEGLANKEIAARLNISEHTVKFHVSSILGKLGATTRGEAVARGVREGLIAI
jgi:two-component system, NarL family, response regulator YdfI